MERTSSLDSLVKITFWKIEFGIKVKFRGLLDGGVEAPRISPSKSE